MQVEAGTVDHRILDAGLSQYITGLFSDMQKESDPRLLPGQEPEFLNMSRRPGIGYPAVEAIVSTLSETSFGALALSRLKDVPTALQVGGSPLPLGPYLRTKLRQELFGDHHQPLAAKELIRERTKAEAWSKVPDVLKVAGGQALSVATTHAEMEILTEKNKTRQVRADQLKYRYSIQKQRKKL